MGKKSNKEYLNDIKKFGVNAWKFNLQSRLLLLNIVRIENNKNDVDNEILSVDDNDNDGSNDNDDNDEIVNVKNDENDEIINVKNDDNNEIINIEKDKMMRNF